MRVTLSHLIESIASKYRDNNDVFVVGKGASIDQIDLEHLGEGLVININDSECILAGDICLFRKAWVLDSLHRHGFRCGSYITPGEIAPPAGNVVVVDSVPESEESGELVLYRFLSDGLILENVLLVSALKLAQLIGACKKRPQRTYLLGFDFRVIGRAYSKRVLYDFSEHTDDFKRSVIWLQERHLIDILSVVQEKKVDWLEITHVGNLPYSRLTCEQFNCNYRHRTITRFASPPLHGADLSLAPEAPRRSPDVRVLIVAEFTNNHLGDIARLRSMVRLAAEAGADLVKVQKRDVDTFYSIEQLSSPYPSPFGKTLGDYRRGVELAGNGFEALDEECRKYGIDWFCSVLDYPSYRFADQFGKRLIKLPSTVSERRDFLVQIAGEYSGDLVISTGFTNSGYEEFVVRCFSRNNRIYLLQANSAYPTAPFECSIAVVRHYRDLGRIDPRIIPGYSSHDLGSLGSMLAVAAGAQMLEKHVKLGDTPWVHFDHVALDLERGEFANYVKDVRLAEQMCGDENKRIHRGEHHKYPALDERRTPAGLVDDQRTPPSASRRAPAGTARSRV